MAALSHNGMSHDLTRSNGEPVRKPNGINKSINRNDFQDVGCHFEQTALGEPADNQQVLSQNKKKTDQPVLTDFRSNKNREIFKQRVNGCKLRRLVPEFYIFAGKRVELFLDKDSVSTGDEAVSMYDLQNDLGISPDVELKISVLDEVCEIEWSTDPDVAPGDDIFAMREQDRLVMNVACFILNEHTRKRFVITTGHGDLAVGDALHIMHRNERLTIADVIHINVPSTVARDKLGRTIDVSVAELRGGLNCLSNMVEIEGRTLSLSRYPECSWDAANEQLKVQKFCRLHIGPPDSPDPYDRRRVKIGKITGMFSEDISFRSNHEFGDCLAIAAEDEFTRYQVKGESGTLVIRAVERGDGDCEVQGIAVLIAVLPAKVGGRERYLSIAMPFDHLLTHLDSLPMFSSIEMLNAVVDTSGSNTENMSTNNENPDETEPRSLETGGVMEYREESEQASVVAQEEGQSSHSGNYEDVDQSEAVWRLDEKTLFLQEQLEQLVSEILEIRDSQQMWHRQEKLTFDKYPNLQRQWKKALILSDVQFLPNMLISPNLVMVEADVSNKVPKSSLIKLVSKRKIICDVIHGNIELHQLLVAIIDTPQFQRLRNIKQLPGAYFVFPGAAHNRFEHSIGVAYLAGNVVKRLRKQQPELYIDQSDVLCVQIAGLCQYLGIGPLSHVDGEYFFGKDLKHEDMSLKMFDYMVATNNLRQQFSHYGLTEQDVIFIREQIQGVQLSDQASRCQGRSPNKHFLYQIVSDRQSGLDVDAWDCYLRDSYHLQIKTAFDHKRLIKFLRVSTVADTGQRIICIRDKEVDSLYSGFTTRLMHNRNAIQHKVSVAVETMLADAMKLADDYTVITGSNCQKFKLSTAFRDVVAFSKLDDSIYHRIRHSRQPELAKAREILENIEVRQLYQLVEECKPTIGADARPIIADVITVRLADELNENVAVAQVITFDYGKARNQKLVGDIHCFNQQCPANALPSSRRVDFLMCPTRYREYIIRVYCKHRDLETVEKVRESFRRIQQELSVNRSTPAKLKVSTAVRYVSQVDDSIFHRIPYSRYPGAVNTKQILVDMDNRRQTSCDRKCGPGFGEDTGSEARKQLKQLVYSRALIQVGKEGQTDLQISKWKQLVYSRSQIQHNETFLAVSLEQPLRHRGLCLFHGQHITAMHSMPYELHEMLLKRSSWLLAKTLLETDARPDIQLFNTLSSVCRYFHFILTVRRRRSVRTFTKQQLTVACHPFGLRPVQLATIVGQRGAVWSLCTLNNVLYVNHSKCTTINVYTSHHPYTLLRHIQTPLGRITDIASCSINNCVYIAGRDTESRRWVVNRVTTGGKLVPWLQNVGIVRSLSVTSGGEVVLLIANDWQESAGNRIWRGRVEVCNSAGVKLTWFDLPRYLISPWGAVQTANKHFIVSHGNEMSEHHRVCKVNNEGSVVESYGGLSGCGFGQLDLPTHFAVDREERVIVADINNRRALLLDKQLTIQRVLLTWLRDDDRPCSLFYETNERRLFVGFDTGEVQIYRI